MARAKKQVEADVPDGAPEWMVTFSDCMTLLLTFFVLLLSFSSFDEQEIMELMKVLSKEFNVSNKTDKEKKAFTASSVIQQEENYKSGSEKPTLIKGEESSTLAESKPDNFQDRKVFTIPSGNIFWGKGQVISHKGNEVLSEMASFLKKKPNRIVISENEAGIFSEGGNDLGLSRAWAVTDYLINKCNLDGKLISISAGSTTIGGQDTGVDKKVKDVDAETVLDRNIEIVFLERSIYN